MKTNGMNRVLMLMCACMVALTMSAQKQIRPIYFDNPAQQLNSADMPEGMQALLDFYDDALKQVAEGADPTAFFTMEKATAADSVPALLGKIEWGQDAPYNNSCPKINGKRAVTGCVATAMAQVMRYYKYPNKGTGTCTYTGASGATTLDLSTITFDWNNMKEQYVGNYTTAQATAVAQLMLACGAALNMNYSSDGSGSNTSKVAGIMKKNFAFNSTISYVDFGDGQPDFEDWEEFMREQFQSGYPIIFSGYPAVGKTGHCFVIDGYKAIDGVYYYHVNWGWDGSYNGYYLLTNLRPSDESYSGYGCVLVYNIFPPGWTDVEEMESTTFGIDPKTPIYNILGMQVSFENLQHGNIYIQKGKKILY